jgi:hypothetical protein
MARAALSYHNSFNQYEMNLGSTHKFVIFDVQENEFWPEVGSFRGFDDLFRCVKRVIMPRRRRNTLGILMRATKSLRCSITCKKKKSARRDYNETVLSTFFRSVFTIQDGEFCEDAHLYRMVRIEQKDTG